MPPQRPQPPADNRLQVRAPQAFPARAFDPAARARPAARAARTLAPCSAGRTVCAADAAPSAVVRPLGPRAPAAARTGRGRDAGRGGAGRGGRTAKGQEAGPGAPGWTWTVGGVGGGERWDKPVRSGGTRSPVTLRSPRSEHPRAAARGAPHPRPQLTWPAPGGRAPVAARGGTWGRSPLQIRGKVREHASCPAGVYWRRCPPHPPRDSSSGPESGGGSGKEGDLNKDVYRRRTMDGGGGSWAPAQPRGRSSRLVMAHPAWPPPRARAQDGAAPRPCSSGCGHRRLWSLRPTKPPRAAPPEGSCPPLVERQEGSRRDSEKANTHCPVGPAPGPSPGGPSHSWRSSCSSPEPSQLSAPS